MRSKRKDRNTFRPSVVEASLEDRLVLSSNPIVFNNGMSLAFRLSPAVRVAARPAQVSVAQAGVQNTSTLTVRQLRRAFLQQSRAAATALRQMIKDQATQLFANGTPTPQQLADFNAMVNGAIDATAFQLSSQAALLPGSNRRLVPAIQNALLGDRRNSLLNRVQAITQSSRTTRSAAALQAALGRQLNTSLLGVNNQLNGFFATTNLNRLSVDQNGQRIPLQQFLGGQVINQFGNTLGALSQSFPTVANSVLFPNGATTATADAQAALANQTRQALGIAAFQLGSNLALFPDAATTVGPQLQSALFGTGAGAHSLFSSLQGLPTTSTGFNTAASTAFTNGFQGLVSPLSSFFGLPSQQTFSLPTSNITGIFGPSFTGNSFFNGFNNGFGSGFIGFGQSPTGFNSNFGTGFNNLVGNAVSNFGFTLPTLGTGTGGVGTGTGIGGIGTGVGGVGTGVGGVGTGVGTGIGGVGTGVGTGAGGVGTGVGTGTGGVGTGTGTGAGGVGTGTGGTGTGGTGTGTGGAGTGTGGAGTGGGGTM
jgi:hypothetical protein